jgi:hypothetical protein
MMNNDRLVSTQMVRNAWESLWNSVEPDLAGMMLQAFDAWLADRTLENDTQLELARSIAGAAARDAGYREPIGEHLSANPRLCVEAQRVLAASGNPNVLFHLSYNPNLHSSIIPVLMDVAFVLLNGSEQERAQGEYVLDHLVGSQVLTDEQQVRLATGAPFAVRRALAWPWLRNDRTVPLCAGARDVLARDRSSRIRRLIAEYWGEDGYPLAKERDLSHRL